MTKYYVLPRTYDEALNFKDVLGVLGDWLESYPCDDDCMVVGFDGGPCYITIEGEKPLFAFCGEDNPPAHVGLLKIMGQAIDANKEHIALLRKENEALQKQVSSLKKALVKLGLEQE